MKCLALQTTLIESLRIFVSIHYDKIAVDQLAMQ